MKRYLPWVACLVLTVLLAGCDRTPEEEAAAASPAAQGCADCHPTALDAAHRFDCLDCHRPVAEGSRVPEDHPPVLAEPAHPDYAASVCGPCHARETEMVLGSSHYLLSAHIDLVRAAFGIDRDDGGAPPATRLSSHEQPEDAADLVDDLLSRRCLRCHVYYPGDDFSSVRHGTGCAACHLAFREGAPVSHDFTAPPDDARCLSCHYGSHVGYDYHGSYEHDLNDEYRTPYRAGTPDRERYGVEAHDLDEDVHRRAGMVCIDCHTGEELMGSGAPPRCRDCHPPGPVPDPDTGPAADAAPVPFVSAATGMQFAAPRLTHPAHFRYGDRFSCQVCHARWLFNDAPTHLLRIDHEDFDAFSRLALDGSAEVLNIISSHIDEDGDLLEPEMSDKFSGETVPGIWFRGFGERRWGLVTLVEDDSGTITTGRPMLDLRLSWIDDEEESRFDNLEPLPGVRRVLPYAPHTIGKAGLFWEERLRPYLTAEPQ